jgi:hypothetical protein
VSVIQAMSRSLKWEDCALGCLGQNVRPHQSNNQFKKTAGGMAQVVECLPSKCEALSLNPSMARKNNSRNKHCKNYIHVS